MEILKQTSIGVLASLLLAVAIPASAATLELQLVGSNITGLADNTNMWNSGTSTAIPWLDATANHRDAVSPASYWSPSYQEGETDVFGEEDYLYFSNNDSMSGSASLSGWGFTSMVVANYDTTATVNRGIMSFYDVDNSSQYLTFTMLADGNLEVVLRGGSWQQYILRSTGQDFRGKDHLFAVEYQADFNISVYVDGESVSMGSNIGSGTTTVTLTDIDTYRLRAGGNGSNNTNIAEARYYSGDWGTGELESVTSNLMDTYDISPEPGTICLFIAAGTSLIMKRRRCSK